MSGKLIELRALSIGYGGRGRNRAEGSRLVAADIEAAVGGGDFVCLLGPNGSGKSTLLKTLAGMLPALGGDCLIAGRRLSALPLSEKAELVSIVLTEQPNAGWFSVFEIVAFGRYPYTDARGRLSAADRERVRQCISAVGLSAFENRRFAELSDGERRKALVARALAQDTPLILLDEPTVYLDAPSRIELFALVRDICRRENRAVILSTHELDLALDNADRVWLMIPAQGPSCAAAGVPAAQSRFVQGLPEELALAGTLDSALSTRGTRYDAALGCFVPRSAAAPQYIDINYDNNSGTGARSAETGLLLKWAGHLARRAGFLPEAGGGPVLRLSLDGSAANPGWRLFSAGGSPLAEGSGLAALAGVLGKVAQEKNGQNR